MKSREKKKNKREYHQREKKYRGWLNRKKYKMLERKRNNIKQKQETKGQTDQNEKKISMLKKDTRPTRLK